MAYTKQTKRKTVDTKDVKDTKEVKDVREDIPATPVAEEKGSNRPVADVDWIRPQRTQRTYNPSDVIPCHSIVGGYVNFLGKKTGTVYSWYDNGDISNIEYQDLRAAMLSKSPYIFGPIIVVDDEELLELPEWKAVKELYEQMYSVDDLTKIFDLPVNQMADVVRQLPTGVKRTLITLAKTMVDDGRLESIKKIKTLDKELGTDLLNEIIDG